MSEELKAAQARIACLEGEIAKRDARIVELDKKYGWALSELSAIKAQGPVVDEQAAFEDWITRVYPGGDCSSVTEQWLASSDYADLYAAPVSEAKAQVYEPLVCDYCNAETQDPWHGSGMLNGVESRHIHACSQCRNLLPTAKALAVRDEEIERSRVQLMTIASADPARHNIEWAKAVAATGNNEVYAKWRAAFDQRDQQAQRIGELASHLEFAVTLLTVAGLAGNAQVEAMRAALSASSEPKQCT